MEKNGTKTNVDISAYILLQGYQHSDPIQKNIKRKTITNIFTTYCSDGVKHYSHKKLNIFNVIYESFFFVVVI